MEGCGCETETETEGQGKGEMGAEGVEEEHGFFWWGEVLERLLSDGRGKGVRWRGVVLCFDSCIFVNGLGSIACYLDCSRLISDTKDVIIESGWKGRAS